MLRQLSPGPVNGIPLSPVELPTSFNNRHLGSNFALKRLSDSVDLKVLIDVPSLFLNKEPTLSASWCSNKILLVL